MPRRRRFSTLHISLFHHFHLQLHLLLTSRNFLLAIVITILLVLETAIGMIADELTGMDIAPERRSTGHDRDRHRGRRIHHHVIVLEAVRIAPRDNTPPRDRSRGREHHTSRDHHRGREHRFPSRDRHRDRDRTHRRSISHPRTHRSTSRRSSQRSLSTRFKDWTAGSHYFHNLDLPCLRTDT